MGKGAGVHYRNILKWVDLALTVEWCKLCQYKFLKDNWISLEYCKCSGKALTGSVLSLVPVLFDIPGASIPA